MRIFFVPKNSRDYHFVRETLTRLVVYSQLSLRRTPSGPAPTVRLTDWAGCPAYKVSVKRELTVQSTLSKTDTIGTSTNCPSYRGVRLIRCPLRESLLYSQLSLRRTPSGPHQLSVLERVLDTCTVTWLKNRGVCLIQVSVKRELTVLDHRTCWALLLSCRMPVTRVLLAVTQTHGVIHYMKYVLLLHHTVK